MTKDFPIMKIRGININMILSQENVRNVKEIDNTGKKARLMLFDIDGKLVGITPMYTKDYLRKKVSEWLFRDFPKGV